MSVIGIDIPLPCLGAEVPPANYDEEKVPTYSLPDPLLTSDSQAVDTAKAWTDKRRGELLDLFAKHVYGRTPNSKAWTGFADCWKTGTPIVETTSEEESCGGKAIRKEVRFFADIAKEKPLFDVLIYLPKSAQSDANKRIPAVLCPNFRGNHTVSEDPGITLGEVWVDAKKGDRTLVPQKAEEASRGAAKSRWPIETIVDRGYALVTVYYSQIEPDFHGGIEYGIRKDMPRPDDGDWGAIGAWAFGLSRIMDYLVADGAGGRIDAERVVLMGHSRLGKTSLWAGAQDERFAIVVTNNSGCGGAALSRREFGETMFRMNTTFPHWCCRANRRYNERPGDCPVDQHELIALIAPRPVYVASAVEDRWADPYGEFLSCVHADPVYRLLDTKGFGDARDDGKIDPPLPELNEPVGATIRYHIRSGKHDVTDYDWDRYLDFANEFFKQKSK